MRETDIGDPLAVLQSAARELLPVVVDLGPDQAKFSSFIGSVSEGDGGRMVLDPIAAEALPVVVSGPVRITPAAGAETWSIQAHRMERAGSTRVCVNLSQARLIERAERERSIAVQSTDLLVLVVPGGLNEGSEYVFPVQRIGSELCEIRCSTPLRPGDDLPCVELVGDRRLLRRAAAHVLDVAPWYSPDGSRSFSCRVSLSDEAGSGPGDAHDLVTDAREVRRLLDLAGMLRAPGWFEAPGFGRGRLQFMEVGPDHALLQLSAPVQRNALPPRSLRIGVELFANAYELDVRAIELQQTVLRTALPLILRRRRRHRRDQRVPVEPDHGVELSFRNPVSGAVHSYPVVELSFFGVCFEFEPHAAVLWRGMPLEQAQVSWRSRLVHLGDASVEQYYFEQSTGRARCVATLSESRVSDDPDMISLLASLAHPQVRVHDGGDFSALHRTYLKAGLFGPHMHRNLGPIVEQTKEVWRRAHGEAAEVVRTFVHGPVQAPDAAVTVMRAWEHAWVAQHFVDTSPELNGATGKLQSAYLDHLVPRPDGRYLIFFVKTDNRVMNAYLKRFFASTGTPDAVTRSTVELWSRAPDSAPTALSESAMKLSVQPCGPDYETLVARAFQRCLGNSAAAALSMVPGELELPDTQRRFAQAGLARDRTCQLVMREGLPAYGIVEERSTPGLNLTWMLNACWIVPTHRELDPDGAAFERALASVVERPAQTVTGERFLNLPEGLDTVRLQRWGFVKEASVYLYVLTRAGLHRFFHYATSRYGEIDALSLRRDRRRLRAGGSEPP